MARIAQLTLGQSFQFRWNPYCQLQPLCVVADLLSTLQNTQSKPRARLPWGTQLHRNNWETDSFNSHWDYHLLVAF